MITFENMYLRHSFSDPVKQIFTVLYRPGGSRKRFFLVAGPLRGGGGEGLATNNFFWGYQY